METTIVTILKKEKHGYEKASVICDVKVNFFTDEREERFLRMEIEPVSNKLMYLFVVTAHNQLDLQEFVSNEPKTWVAKAGI